MDNRICKVLIPAAGRSERFKEKTPRPKGLVTFTWNGRKATMLEHVINTVPLPWLKLIIAHEQDREWFLKSGIFVRNDRVLLGDVDRTRGQADTVFQALEGWPIDTNEDFLIVNSDNAIKGLELAVYWFRQHKVDAGVVVFDDIEMTGRYGYINDAHGFPRFTHTREKIAISKFAFAGAFYFRDAFTYQKGYLPALEALAPKQEIYISHVLNHIGGLKLAAWIDRKTMLHEWGTAADLENDKSVAIDWSENQ
jgi:hypothetical protein